MLCLFGIELFIIMHFWGALVIFFVLKCALISLGIIYFFLSFLSHSVFPSYLYCIWRAFLRDTIYHLLDYLSIFSNLFYFIYWLLTLSLIYKKNFFKYLYLLFLTVLGLPCSAQASHFGGVSCWKHRLWGARASGAVVPAQ